VQAQTPKPPTGSQPATPAPAGEAAKPNTGNEPAPAQTPDQQLAGLRAWVAQVDRKLGIRSYAGAAALVLALAAGIVGVVLAVSAKDESATKDEVSALSEQIESVSEEASATVEDDVASLRERLDGLQTRLDSLAAGQRTSDRELDVVQSDIDELRNQISDVRRSSGGGGGVGATTTTTTTTTTETTPTGGGQDGE
jgi:uncharacterized protein HemX